MGIFYILAKNINNMISREDLRKAVDELFTQPKPNERRISGARGCIIRGWVDVMDFSHCGDESCPSCNMMSEALNREMTTLFKNIPVEKSKGCLLEELNKISATKTEKK
jgi:hypothetical protein